MKNVVGKICNALGVAILLAIILAAGAILALQLLGYRPMAILSGSMEPNYNVGGLVFIDTNARAEEVEVGDVVTFKAGEETVITHRVIAIDGREFTTKGDANNAEDLAPVPFEAVVGKAWVHVPRLGYALMNLETRQGFAVGAILVAVLITLFVVPALLAPTKPAKKEGISNEV